MREPFILVNQENCQYHPSRIAVDKCQRCNRMICLKDKMVVNSQRSTGFGEMTSYYNVQVVFCPICKYEANVEGKEKMGQFGKIGGSMMIGFMIFAIFIFGFAIYSFNQMTSDFPVSTGPSPGDIFGPMIGFFAIGILLMVVIFRFGTNKMGSMMDRNIEQAKREKDEFLNSVENKSFLLEYQSKDTLICNQCGSEIPRDSLFCMNCGDPTKDERMTQ